MKRLWLALGLILCALLLVTGCSGNGAASPSAASASASAAGAGKASVSASASASTSAAASGEKTFTLQELSKYTGKNGNPAYIAVSGVVYDVSNNSQWHNGTHNGQSAGNDLTTAIKSAPHGTSILKNLPVVGKLVG